jgi:DNA phosphorothioation-dependent restriction protein DptH
LTTKLSAEQRGQIIALLREGIQTRTIAERLGINPRQVAAIAAHLTMNTYEDRTVAQASDSPVSADDATETPNKPDNRGVRLDADVEILIGTDIDTGQSRFWSPTPASGTPNPHLLIVGESGSGKTYASQCICAELAHEGIPTIVFDFGQGFALDTTPREFAESAEPVEIRGGRDGININPLQIFSGDIHGPVNVAQRIADTFARVYPAIGIQQHAALRDAVLQAFSDVGIDADTKSTWGKPPPRFADLKLALDTLADDKRSGARKFAAAVASHISAVFLFNTFRAAGLDLNWERILGAGGKTYIIQLKGLESSLEQVVTELLVWNLIGYIESLGPGPLRAVVLLDEAHRLSFSANSPVEKLLREGRKFGLGIILASQQPDDFSPVAFSNTASKLVFSIFDTRGAFARQVFRKNEAASATLLHRLQSLARGEAAFISMNAVSMVKISGLSQRIVRWRQR